MRKWVRTMMYWSRYVAKAERCAREAALLEWMDIKGRESRELRSGASSNNTESRARRGASSSRTESRERRSASSSTGGDWELERRLEVEGAKRRERKRGCCV